MKNKEVYFEELKIYLFYEKPCGFIRSHVLPELVCKNNCLKCKKILDEWLEEEYEEPIIDWSIVPPFTRVLVRDITTGRWIKQYFISYLPNDMLGFLVSKELLNEDEGYLTITKWKYCKLVNKDDIEKYRKKVN